MLHRKIVDDAIAHLPKEKASYFAGIAQRLEEDPRTQATPNLVFLVLKETLPMLPTNLSEGEFVDLLLGFVARNRRVLNSMIFDRRFIENPSFLRQITNDLVGEVVGRTLDLYRDGRIESGEQSFYRVTFPSGEGDFPYVDDDDEDEDDY